MERPKTQSGTVTFLQSWDSTLHMNIMNIHVHLIGLESIYLNRTARRYGPQYIQVLPHTDTEIVDVMDGISSTINQGESLGLVGEGETRRLVCVGGF